MDDQAMAIIIPTYWYDAALGVILKDYKSPN